MSNHPPTYGASPRGWRILACDLDGTLIGPNNKAHDVDLEALHRARAAGLHVAICTGRNPLECKSVVAALDLAGPAVFANGAMISEMGDAKTLSTQPFPVELIDATVDFFGSRGHAVLVLADHPQSRLPAYLMTNHAPPHRATREWQLHHKTHSEVVAEIPAYLRPHAVRLSIVVNVPESLGIVRDLAATFGEQLNCYSIYSTYFDCQVIEVFGAGVSKWSGLVRMAERLGVQPTEIVTMGDDVNDIEMLREAALSFAMGNAAETVQRCAKRVTATQAEHGVAAVVKGVLAGEW